MKKIIYFLEETIDFILFVFNKRKICKEIKEKDCKNLFSSTNPWMG